MPLMSQRTFLSVKLLCSSAVSIFIYLWPVIQGLSKEDEIKKEKPTYCTLCAKYTVGTKYLHVSIYVDK